MDQQPPPFPDTAELSTSARPGGIRGFCLDLLGVLRFFSRLPLPSPKWDPAPHAPPNFAGTGALTVPLAGAIIGAIGALVGYIALKLGLSPPIAAILAIGTLCIVTGCLHEDGLADCCDGFFGGSTPERRREIMKDSRLGTFGVVGLVISIALRVVALAELLKVSGLAGLWLVIGIAAASRFLALLPALITAPAGGPNQGLAQGLAMPGIRAYFGSGVVALVLLGAAAGLAGLAGALAQSFSAGLIATIGASHLARAKIGGYTGDVLGAAQQVAEITLLLVLAAATGWQ